MLRLSRNLFIAAVAILALFLVLAFLSGLRGLP